MANTNQRLDKAAKRAERDLDASRAAVSVMKASSRLSQAIERALAPADLTLPQFNVLMQLAASPDDALPQHAIIARLVSTPSNLSWLTTRMRDLGLITKDRDSEDNRVVVLRLTEAGWAALEEAMPKVFAAEKELWRHHRRADLRALTEQLQPLVK